MIPHVEPGDLVILKGGIVARVLRLQRPDRVAAETWYPRAGLRLVPYDHILDRATRRRAPDEGP